MNLKTEPIQKQNPILARSINNEYAKHALMLRHEE